MRIVSQLGDIDMPYENVGLVLCEIGNEYAIEVCCIGSSAAQLMAEYSTPKKAKKAMEMLRMAYCGICNVEMQSEHTEEDAEKFMEAMKNAPIQAVNGKLGIVECKIFQFPKDEEIEVDK